MPQGRFSVRGRRIPGRAASFSAAPLTAEDPFRIHGVADYEIIEFSPVKRLPGFEAFL